MASVTYSFLTELGATLTRAPLGAAFLDKLLEDTSTTTPVIANRIPAPRIPAQIEARNSEPYALADNMTMLVYTPYPTIAVSAAEPFNLSNGATLLVRIDEAYLQEIILDNLTAGNASAEEVARSISLQLRNARVTLDTNETKIKLSTHSSGLSPDDTSNIVVEGGTAATELNFTVTQPTAGVSLVLFSSELEFVDIGAATAEEVVDYLNARLTTATAAITDSEDRFRLFSDYSKVYCSGQAAEVLGLSSWAHLSSGAAEPYALQEESTLILSVDGGYEQTIYFRSNPAVDVTHSTAEYVVQVLNTQLKGATAELSEEADRVELRSNTESSLSSLQVIGGSANTLLQFPTDLVHGVGYGERVIAEAQDYDAIKFDLFDPGSSGLADFSVYVTTNLEKTLVYDSSIPYTATGWTVTVVESLSPGASVNDIYNVTLQHSSVFISDELVSVHVHAATNDLNTLDITYDFAVEDTRRPTVQKITSWTPNKLRIKFSEPMDQGTERTSIYYTRDISGRVTYMASDETETHSNVVDAPTAEFTEDDVGLFLGSRGARNALNNFAAEIVEWISATRVSVDTPLTYELPANPSDKEPVPQLIISPYRLIRDTQDDPYLPTFVPIVTSAEEVETIEIVSGDDAERYVDLIFHDALSPSAKYKLELTRVTDVAGNEIGSIYPFTSWSLNYKEGRNWNLPDFIPQVNWDEDYTGDLAKLMNVFNDAAQVMLNEVDTFGNLFDPWACKDSVVDILLAHLGNPFSFARSLPLAKKRDLISILVPMYKLKGTNKGIENTVLFFLNKTVRVKAWEGHTDAWVLGESFLGYNTYLDPSKSFVRYSFVVQHIAILTDDEKTIINEIVHFMRPAHTHFIGYEKVVVF